MRGIWLALLPLLLGAADYEMYPSGAGVPTNTKLLVRLPCCGGLTAEPMTVRAGNETVPGRTENLDFQWLAFTPSQPLRANTTYSVSVNLPDRPPFSATITTGTGPDTTPPELVSTSPTAGGDTGGSFRYPVLLRFSEPINPLSFSKAPPVVANLTLGGSGYGTATTLADERTVKIMFPLGPGMAYRLHFPNGLPEDLAGNKVAPPGPDFVFTTYPEAPKDGAKVRGSIPADGDTEVATNAAIFLTFDRPLGKPDETAFSLGSDGDPAVALTAETLEAKNALILRPKTLLRGNQRYTLRINRLYDAYGGQVAAGPLLSFTTALLPELRQFTQLVAPRASMPRVTRVRWTYSRPLNPWLLPRVLSLTGTSYNAPEVSSRLLDGGMTLEADIANPGEYVLAGNPYDRVESKPLPLHPPSFIVTHQRDDRAPSVLFTVPPDQATGISPEVTPSIVFDEEADSAVPDGITLWKGAERVQTTFSVDSVGSRYVLKPSAPLEDGAEYRVEFRAPRDLSENIGADVTSSFRVEAARPVDAFGIVAIEPVPGTQDVPASSQVIITFNRPPDPSGFAGCTTIFAGPEFVTGVWRIEGSRAVFQPDFRLPGSTRIAITLCAINDLRGQSVPRPALISFLTAPDPEPPAPLLVTSLSPDKGEFAVAGDRAVLLEFSQPIARATLGIQPVSVTGPDGQNVARGAFYNPLTRQLAVSTQDSPDGAYTVSTDASIRSVAGAVLEPFSATVQLRRRAPFSSMSPLPPPTYIRSVEGRSGAADPIVIVYFSQAMDRAFVESSLRVVAGEIVMKARIEWTPDSRAVVLYLSGPLPPFSDQNTVILSLAPWGRAGAELQAFHIPEPLHPSVFRWNVTQPRPSIPSDGILEIEFDADRPAGYVRSANAWTGNNIPLMPFEVIQRTPRLFRLRPTRPLAAEAQFGINVETQDGLKESLIISTYKYATPESRQMHVGPTLEMGEVPLNAVIWLQSKTMLNLLTVRPTILVNGETAVFTTEVLDSGFLILLHPRGLLRGNAVYQVSLTGMEDQAGRALPDRTWSFRTGAGPDLTPVAVESWTPSQAAGTDMIPRVTFTRPVYFRRDASQSYRVETPDDFSIPRFVSGTIDFSADGRTLSYTPNRPWPVDTRIDLRINRHNYLGWTNTEINESMAPTFSTGSGTSAP